MTNELEDLREHLERYRAVTLQHLDILSDEELGWRPRPDAFSCGQHLVHILHTEEFLLGGIFGDDWSMDKVRFPTALPTAGELRERFAAVRAETLERLSALGEDGLDRLVSAPHTPKASTVRSWLWFLLEHEIHHKAQLSEYLRQMGHVPPYFAIPLPLGERPDIAARAALGGV